MMCLMQQVIPGPTSHATRSQTPCCQLSAPQCVASVFLIDNESEGIAQQQRYLGPLARVDIVLDIMKSAHFNIRLSA